MKVLTSRHDPASETSRENREGNLARIAELHEQQRLARAGGGEKYVERHRARGRMLARERIELLLDPDAPFLELSTVTGVGHRVHGGRQRRSPGSGWSAASSA